jgi:putative nucleotidyltransferase with HDIG domain
MSDPISVDQVLARVDNLPTLSQVAVRVGELVNDPRTNVRDIAAAMQNDPSLSAKVLRLVNSPYYAIPGGVSDVARAISFVGFSTLHQLVLSVSVLRNLRTPGGAGIDGAGLWLHALAVATCAEVIARRIGARDPGTCFTAGLMHDVGKIALALTEPERYGSAVSTARREGVPMHVAERRVGLPTHDRVGSRLGRRWRFPAHLLAPIELHHAHGEQIRRSVSPSLLTIIDVVSSADAMCRRFALGDGGSPPPEGLGDELARLGLTTLQVDPIHIELMQRLERSKIFLELVDADPAFQPASGSTTSKQAPRPGAGR